MADAGKGAAGAGVNEEELDRLWAEYKKTGNPDLKNEILLNYIYLVKWIVRRMMPKYNRYSEFDDLVNCGVIGLIDAVDKYSLEHGVRFEVYAVSRIRGEILDHMRAQDWAPPSMRKKINAISGMYEMMENDGGRATDEAVARELDMTVEQVQKIMTQAHMFNVINFEDTINSNYAVNRAPVPEDSTPENVLLGKETKRLLAEMIDTLPEKERLVISLYYYEGLLLKEIAEILEVSESRVSQIHSKVLMKLKNKLQRVI